MRRHQFTFTSEEVARLAALIGAEWLYVAGDTLSPDFNTPVEVVVGTTVDSITIYSEQVPADFEDPDLEYAVLSIRDVEGRFEAAKRSGNVYVHHQHEQILDVQIVRETITEIENGTTMWEYTTDVGVVFVLGKGAIAIAKGSHHTEMLAVRTAGSVEDLDIPDRTVEWEDDLTVQYRSTREFIPVDALA